MRFIVSGTERTVANDRRDEEDEKNKVLRTIEEQSFAMCLTH